MIQIDNETVKRLKRLAELHAKFYESEGIDDDVCKEYRQLLTPTLCEFVPVVQMLAAAGLFTLSIRNSPDSDPRKYTQGEYDAARAFENGNIWLCAGEAVGWMEVKQPNRHFKPSEFPYDPKAYFTGSGEWKGWRAFLGAPAGSPICDECGYDPCQCAKEVSQAN